MANSVSRIRRFRRLTDEEVRATVALMGLTGPRRDTLLELALGGDTGARFVVTAFRARVVGDLEEEGT